MGVRPGLLTTWDLGQTLSWAAVSSPVKYGYVAGMGRVHHVQIRLADL